MIIPLFTNPKYIWPSPESITARIIVKPRFFTNICTTIKLLNRLSKKLGKGKTDKAFIQLEIHGRYDKDNRI